MIKSGARTPEELESLLEDAFIVHDTTALGLLFEDGAVLDPGRAQSEVRGRADIERAAMTMWDHDRTYLAEPRRVLQAGDTALSLGGGIKVARRGPDGAWRFAIAVIEPE
ncbi:MAG: hypothetical protein WKH68_12065 [Candidatus Limnocylindria bacterium]